MILFNVTYGIDKEVEVEWVAWMKETHIPKVLNTGLFEGYRFYKVLTHEEENSSSYCIQYFTPTINHFNKYLEEFANSLMEEHRQRFRDKHVAFNTLLEEVE